MRITIHQPQFLPWLGYLDKIDQADLFVALDNVQFKKNEWQNRNRIRTAQGWQWLTVPVLHRFGQHVNDVRINSTVTWQAQHLRSLAIHYARAPYRDQYIGELREVYETGWDRLSELNLAVLRWLLRAFGITTPIRLASDWTLREEATDRLVDICRMTGANVLPLWSGRGCLHGQRAIPGVRRGSRRPGLPASRLSAVLRPVRRRYVGP